MAGDLAEPGTVSVKEVREELKHLSKEHGGKVPSIKLVQNVTLQELVKVRIYKNTDKSSVPVMMFFHGGNWTAGDLESHDILCRRFAAAGDVIVVSVDFRRPPESPYPAALDDAFLALNWVFKNIHNYGGNAFQIAVGGDSSGGNISAALTLLTRDRSGPMIGFQYLIYPVTNLDSLTLKSYEYFAQGFFLRTTDVAEGISQYVPNPEKRKEVYASPMLASNLGVLPPGIVVTAEFDPVRDDGEEYARRVNAFGGRLEVSRYRGMIHGFISSDFFPESEMAIKEIVNKVQKRFSP